MAGKKDLEELDVSMKQVEKGEKQEVRDQQKSNERSPEMGVGRWLSAQAEDRSSGPQLPNEAGETSHKRSWWPLTQFVNVNLLFGPQSH